MTDVIALVLIAALFVFAAWLGDRLGKRNR